MFLGVFMYPMATRGNMICIVCTQLFSSYSHVLKSFFWSFGPILGLKQEHHPSFFDGARHEA